MSTCLESRNSASAVLHTVSDDAYRSRSSRVRAAVLAAIPDPLDAHFAEAAVAEIVRADAVGDVAQVAKVNHHDNFRVWVAGYASYGLIEAIDLDREDHVAWFNRFTREATRTVGRFREYSPARSPFIAKIARAAWEAYRA